MAEESKDAPKTTLDIGTMLDSGEARYHIIDILGQGGFGITYLVSCELIVNNVPTFGTFAIKEHFPTAFSDRQDSTVIPKPEKKEEYERSLRDFISEAKKLHMLGTRNDNIVKVNEVFETNGTAYYVMQYIHGKSLSSYVTAKRKLPYGEAITLLSPILDAVGFLHSSRINHLDIKPDNIMLHEREKNTFQPVLIDFGLSVHFKKNGDKTSPKGVQGVSEGYSPLEQYAGVKEFNPATDIYALAATLLYMLTGEVPRGASEIKLADIKATLNAVNEKNGKDQPQIPDYAITAICNAMRKSDEDRTQSVGQFKSELQIDSPSVDTVPIDFTPKNSGGISRDMLYFVIIAISLLVIIVGFIFLKPKGSKKARIAEEPEPVETVAENTELVAQAESDTGEGFLDKLSSIIFGGAPDMKEIEASIAEQKRQASQAKKDEKKKRKETASSSSDSNFDDYQEPETPKITNGTLNLGYGSWKGGIKNGKPDGKGTLTFSSTHKIGDYTANPGDYFTGQYYDGYPASGKLYDSSGTLLKTIIL